MLRAEYTKEKHCVTSPYVGSPQDGSGVHCVSKRNRQLVAFDRTKVAQCNNGNGKSHGVGNCTSYRLVSGNIGKYEVDGGQCGDGLRNNSLDNKSDLCNNRR